MINENVRDEVSGRCVIVASRDQVSTELDDEVVVLQLTSGVYYGLDSIGARIWTLIQQPISVSEICGELLREYEVEPDRCVRDVTRFLQDLVDHDLAELTASEVVA